MIFQIAALQPASVKVVAVCISDVVFPLPSCVREMGVNCYIPKGIGGAAAIIPHQSSDKTTAANSACRIGVIDSTKTHTDQTADGKNAADIASGIGVFDNVLSTRLIHQGRSHR